MQSDLFIWTTLMTISNGSHMSDLERAAYLLPK